MVSALSVLLICESMDLSHQVRDLLQSMVFEFQMIHALESLEDEYRDAIEVCIIDTQSATEQAFELCKRLRQVQPRMGIVCLTRANDPAARIRVLSHGADHALAMPLEPAELVSAIESLARHLKSSELAQQLQQNQPHTIELINHSRCIRGSNSEQALTQSEFVLLQALVRAKGKQLELWQIYDVLGKNEQTLQKAALEAQISRLRKKLKDAGAGNQALRSMRLKGYQLCCPIWIS